MERHSVSLYDAQQPKLTALWLCRWTFSVNFTTVLLKDVQFFCVNCVAVTMI